MYPNLYYFLKDIFGVEWEWARIINSFGLFVALAFIAAAYTLFLEFKRKEKQGFLVFTEEEIEVGKTVSPAELIINFALGFVFGFKILGALTAGEALKDPQSYIFSSQGSLLWGIIVGGIMAGIKWWEKNKQKTVKPEKRKLRIWPHDRVGDITIVAALFGFLGAKIFHNLENWDEFVRDPWGSLFSFSGLTFYGGLIVAAIGVSRYCMKRGIGFRYLIDAAAPGLMLAYAIGRIGCQVAGDGDWGIINSAYVADSSAKIKLAKPGEANQVIDFNKAYYEREFGDLTKVPMKSYKAPSFLPVWMVAYTYPHNVNSQGLRLANCEEQEHCSYLPLPVFPTPFYETVVCFIFFIIIWLTRKRIKIPGVLFAFYLILNGLERFLIEKIRVNTKYHSLPFEPTQAELISTGLIIAGVIMWSLYTIQKPSPPKTATM
ncbi:MAG TPA: prolipoprotein diacylglyceryl transferase family protein [Chitinophagaceae bacterium]|nr:prolipoprotein diacylglyceryl transferase family protein [Chitinophagaceae bacterium]